MTAHSKRLDWSGAIARLERIRESLERAGQSSPDQLAALYATRAERLARPEETPEMAVGAELLLVFRLGEERFALPVLQVEEALPPARLGLVPEAPATVAGVIQVRGAVRPVYDLRRLLGRAGPAAGGGGFVVVVKGGQSPFGVRVDEIEEVRTVRNDEPRLPSHAQYVSWTTEDLVSVLDAGLLWKREA